VGKDFGSLAWSIAQHKIWQLGTMIRLRGLIIRIEGREGKFWEQLDREKGDWLVIRLGWPPIGFLSARVQYKINGNNPRTFTYGRNRLDEYGQEKNKGMDANSNWTIQSYVTRNKPPKKLGGAICHTKNLKQMVEDGHYWDKTTGPKQSGQANFKVIAWDERCPIDHDKSSMIEEGYWLRYV